jgi:hypothetical protein
MLPISASRADSYAKPRTCSLDARVVLYSDRVPTLEGSPVVGTACYNKRLTTSTKAASPCLSANVRLYASVGHRLRGSECKRITSAGGAIATAVLL